MSKETPKPYNPDQTTHYVVFQVDGETYYTDPVTKEQAEILNETLQGLVCPVDINDIMKGKK